MDNRYINTSDAGRSEATEGKKRYYNLKYLFESKESRFERELQDMRNRPQKIIDTRFGIFYKLKNLTTVANEIRTVYKWVEDHQDRLGKLPEEYKVTESTYKNSLKAARKVIGLANHNGSVIGYKDINRLITEENKKELQSFEPAAQALLETLRTALNRPQHPIVGSSVEQR